MRERARLRWALSPEEVSAGPLQQPWSPWEHCGAEPRVELPSKGRTWKALAWGLGGPSESLAYFPAQKTWSREAAGDGQRQAVRAAQGRQEPGHDACGRVPLLKQAGGSTTFGGPQGHGRPGAVQGPPCVHWGKALPLPAASGREDAAGEHRFPLFPLTAALQAAQLQAPTGRHLILHLDVHGGVGAHLGEARQIFSGAGLRCRLRGGQAATTEWGVRRGGHGDRRWERVAAGPPLVEWTRRARAED